MSARRAVALTPLIPAGLVSVVTTRRWSEAVGAALVVILFTAISDLIKDPQTGLSLNEIVVGASLVAIFIRQRGRLVLDRTLVGMLVYALAMLISSVFAVDQHAAIMAAATYLREAIVLVVMLNMLRTRASWHLAVWGVVGAATFLAIAALTGFITGQQLHGLAVPYSGYIADGLSGQRVAGPTGDPDLFAQVLLLGVPVALYWLWHERRLLFVSVAMASTAALLLGIALTYSRGAVVGLLIVLAGAVFRFRPRLTQWAELALILVVIGLAVPPGYWHRLGTTVAFVTNHPEAAAGDESLIERAELWQVGARMLIDHPLTGVGMDNYGLRYGDYYAAVDPALPCCPMGAHNILVRIAAETGLLGLLAFVATIALAVVGMRRAVHQLRAQHRPHAALLLSALELSLYTYLATQLFLDGQDMRQFWLVLSVGVVARQLIARPQYCGGRQR